jgi:hypothetical protein
MSAPAKTSCGKVNAAARAGFDNYLMAIGDQLSHRCWRQADAIFMDFDFLRHANAHDISPSLTVSGSYTAFSEISLLF